MATQPVANTRNLTEFLLRFDEAELKRLRLVYPGASEQGLFDATEHMKGITPLDSARLELALGALDTLITTWSKVAPELASTMNRASRWKFAGAALSVIGGGSSLTVLLGRPDQTTLAAASSALALIGGLVGLVSKYLRRDVYGVDDSLLDKYRQLSKGAAEAAGLSRSLRPYLLARDDGGDKKAMEALVARANQLVAAAEEILKALPDNK